MDNRYKIIISNKNLYKEIELSPDDRELRVGTGMECAVRLHKDLFFGQIELAFSKDSAGQWSVFCSDNLYITVGDVRKLMTKRLAHGDVFEIKYQESDNTVFSVEFRIDFDNGQIRYDRYIDFSGSKSISIGSDSSCNIILSSAYVCGDSIELKKKGNDLLLSIRRTTYGVEHNGKRAESGEIISNGDFFSLSDYFFYYKDNLLWTQIRPDLTVKNASVRDVPENNNYPKFNRNTRVKVVLDEEDIAILDPPAKPQKPKNNLFTRLLPSFGMLIAAGVMAFFGGAMIIFSAISGVMAIITAVVNYRESKKDYKVNTAERIEKYTAYIEKKKEEITQFRQEEKDKLEELYISQQEEWSRLKSFSPQLFDRTPEDEDFLCVKLGDGDVEAKKQVDFKKQERLEIEDELQLMPEQLYNQFRFIHEAPVICDLKNADAVGVIGKPDVRFGMLKNIVMDLVTRHYFTDVKMAFIGEEKQARQIRWLRMLPNVYDEESGLRLIVTNEDSRTAVFEYLYRELTLREGRKRENAGDPRLIVFFFNEYGFKTHPISKFIDKASSLGATFLFFGDRISDVPQGCDYIIQAEDDGKTGTLITTADKSKNQAFTYEVVSDRHILRMVQQMAPVYTEEISLAGSLTKNISMFELLNILDVTDLNLTERWGRSRVYSSMAAPIGVSTTSTIELDLHDKAHGPHGLVAGTTGSGKSEILQTYILSMATLFSPADVAFVIIDFKGGGMVNQFSRLPHLLGAITNIDGKEINRSLKSIKAELQKRQRLFAEADVNHIDKYIRKYKAGEVKVALPHLIIIVDEFAELKAEQPEFMKELISAARIGRSLGVHLILATQKPSGQVNEQIWSNSRFKLCLKVQSQEDSNEVLKSPLAAEIKEPGRAYLQVGNNEIFELFQSAYSGAPERVFDGNVKEFAIYAVSDVGRRSTVFAQKKNKQGENVVTQLDAIVRYVSEYCEDNRIAKLPNIFLPSLEECINFPETVEKAPELAGTVVDLGIYDDPDNQYQGIYSVDIESNNLMIIGSSQSGKTNLLQTIIRSISTKYTPEQVSIYIIDFASMTLKNYESLKHVGGVVTSAEDEKLRNLMKLLFGEIENRKKKLLAIGVSSFAAYREAGMTDMPHLVLMIDNLTALKELYFQDDTDILRLCREGLAVGISVIVANSQTSGIGYKYLSNFSCRIAFFCNDSSEYGVVLDHCREKVSDIHGRCLVDIDKQYLECQTYLAFEGEKEIDRVEKIKAYIGQVNSRCTGRARTIPEIPELLTQSYVAEYFSGFMRENYSLVVGLDYGTVSPLVLPLANLGVLAVSGRDKSGKHNFIKYLVSMLEQRYPGRSSVYIVDGINRRLSGLKDAPNVAKYTYMADQAPDVVMEVEAQLKARYDRMALGGDNVLDDAGLLVIILNSMEAAEAVSGNPVAVEAYRNITGKYKNLNCFVLLGNYDNVNVPYSAPEVIKKAKDGRHFMFFDDLNSLKLLDLPLAIMREYKKPILLGDGYYIRESECVKIKTVKYEEKR